MLDYFIPFLINVIGQREVILLSYHLKLGGCQVSHLLFAYTVLWMEGVKAIDAIGVVIANNLAITRLGVPTHQQHYLPLGKYVCRYIIDVIR